MHHAFESFVMIGAYAALLLVIGIYLALRETKQDFIIGSRRVGVIPTAGSLAASFRDGGGIALWIGMGLAGGYGGLWLFFGIILGSLFMVVYGIRLRHAASGSQYLTISEAVNERLGSLSGKLTALVTLVLGFCSISLQFAVSGSIFSTLLGEPQWVGIALVAALLILYMTMGGYRSVIITDTIQFFLIISLIVAPFFLPMKAEDYTNLHSILTFPANDKVAFTVFGAFYMLSLPEAWQRIYSAKDDRTIRLAFPLMNVFLIVMTISLIWMGMGLRILPAETLQKYAEPYLAIFDPALGISSWFLGYLIMTFLAITMSTQSAACYVFTATLNRLFLRHEDRTEQEQAQYVRRSRWQMASLLALTAVASLTISDVVRFMFDAIGFFICLAPAYMLATVNPDWLHRWRPRDAVMAAITLGGALLFITLFLTGMTKTSFLISTMPAIATAAAVGIVCFVKNRQARSEGASG